MNRHTRHAEVRVAIGHGLPETAVTVSFLRAYGVHAVARTWYHATVAPHLMVALGGIEIRVPPDQRAAAASLLADIDGTNEHLSRPYARRAGLNAVLAIALYLVTSVPPPARGVFPAASAARDPEARSAA